MEENKIVFALAGNPNCGKTTLFNGLTGTRHYVGNWPGVTVEKKEGNFTFDKKEFKVVDLPGTYSLSPYSMEEIVTRNYILSKESDVVVNIVDASNLERNLYLTLQLIELGKPVVMALNMMDIAITKGYQINLEKLSQALQIPIVPIVASKEQGLEDVIKEVEKSFESSRKIKIETLYDENTNNAFLKIKKLLSEISDVEDLEWKSLKILEKDIQILEELDLPNEEIQNIIKNYNQSLVQTRYDKIVKILNDSVVSPDVYKETFSDKVDKFITNQFIGLPIFAIIMYGVFYFTFDLVGNRLSALVELFVSNLSQSTLVFLQNIGASQNVQSLVVDGAIAGVGGILGFLPNIACLFFAITILEDSGYMARVAFIMDKFMNKIGLSGKAFIPMVLGFGCNVPGIMAARTLDDEQDRLVSILINPFMSCSARLPVYTLMAGIFFKGYEKYIVYSLYVLGILVAVFMGLIFKKVLFKGELMPFIMELPEYKMPKLKSVLIRVWERVKGFLIKAGTVILAASIILWFILGYNFSGKTSIDASFGYMIGKFISPIFSPMGFDNWRASFALLTGVMAKEVIVSNLSIAYHVNVDSTFAFAKALSLDFTPASAYSFLVFVLLYTPCIGVIAAIKRETNSWRWTFFSMGYQIVVAYICSLIIYQIINIFI